MNKTMIYLIMAVLAVFGNYNFVQADDEDFRFEAGLLEDSYLSYEPAVLDLTVTNFSEDTLRVQTLSVHSGNVLVILVDQGGDTLKPTESREVIRGPGVLLQPRETYYSNINLNDLYGGGMLHKRLPIGRYKVQAFYSQRSSPILSFEVKEPEESEK
jgi:hypothetical protein